MTILLVVELLLLLVLPSVVSQGESDFACFASTDCHGATVQSPPGRGECCAGRGLSFKPTQMDDCQNCFTEEEFVIAGSEFFLAFFNNLDLRFLSLASLKIRVGNLEDSSQNVRITSRLGETDTMIGGLSFDEITLDKDLRTDGIEDTNNAIVVQSMEQGQLSVSALGDELTSSDTFHVLPCIYLPSLYEYYAVSVQRSTITQSDGDDVFVAPPLGNSVFIVVASEGNTQVTLTLTQTVSVRPSIVAQEGFPTTVILDRAETLFVSSEDSLTGSHIVSNKPIALFSGHECGTLPSSLRYCDQMVEQIPPTSTWGKEFYTVPLITRTMDGFKVISARNDNVLKGACSSVNGTTVLPSMSMNAGQEVDFNISSEYFCHFESDYPVLLVQFSLATEIDGVRNADPLMTVVPPAGQYQNFYMVDHFSGASSGETYYVNIVYLSDDPEAERNQLLLDGQPIDSGLQWTEIKCRSNLVATCAYGIQLEMDDDETIRLSHSNSDARFMAISYTFAFRTGRGSFSGMAQKPIAMDVVTIYASEYRVSEGSGEANITLSRTGDLLDDIIIPFRAHAVPDATYPATPDEDFLEVEMNVTFPAGTSEVVVTVPVTMDDIFPEEDEVFEVYLGASPGAFISPIAYANVTIENDDPPLSVPGRLNTVVSSTTAATISLSWSVSNGSVVEHYEVMWERDTSGECPDEDEGRTTITGGSTTYTITGLEEDSSYTTSVVAINAAGKTSSDPVTGMTREAAPSAPPTSVRTSDVTSSSITVQWGAVDCLHRNGNITGYSVRHRVQGSGRTQEQSVSERATTEVIISGLQPSTTYIIEVAAVNSAGIGVYSDAFSTTTSALTSVTISIVDGAKYADQYDEYIEVEVSWSPVLLGRNTLYCISYYTMQDHLVFQSSEELPGNTTSTTVVVRDPHPGLQHIFTVRTAVKTQSTTCEGPEATASIVFDKAYFQLQFGSVDHCITWTRATAENIEKKLQFEVQEAIYKNCSICRQFSKSFLRRGVFICQSSPTMATYRSTLLNTGISGLTNASSLVSYVQDWVETGPVVRLDWLLVRINENCPVAIQQLSDPECPTPHSLQPELVNHINGVMNTCAVRNLGSQICHV